MKAVKRIKYMFILLFATMLCYAQEGLTNDSIAHFKVRYSNGDYNFLPADNYLFVGGKNRIKITNSKRKTFEVKLANGSIKKIKGDSVFEIDELASIGKSLLSIYEVDAKGNKKLVLNKPYSVIPYPIVKFSGVASDSAMPALMLAAGGLYAHYKSIKTKILVSSFKMEFYENEKFVLDSSVNNRLSKKMLTYVNKLKPGSMVYITNIKFKDPNGSERMEPIYRLFIIKFGNVTSFGL